MYQDRPHTLEWIIKYNIWPGELMIVFFAHLFRFSNQRDLVYILVFVTGVGDGLAEPVNTVVNTPSCRVWHSWCFRKQTSVLGWGSSFSWVRLTKLSNKSHVFSSKKI